MSRRGFTLLEVLIATAILGIILTTVYGVVARTLQAKNHAEARADLYAAGREAILKMADEVEGALPPARDSDSVWFLGVPGAGRVPADAFQFVTVIRRQYSATQGRGGRALVSYSLDPMPNAPNLFALRRQEQVSELDLVADATVDPTTGATGDPTAGDAESPPRPPIIAAHLLDRVAGLRVRYLDPVTGAWKDAWDTAEEPRPGDPPPTLPAAVEMVLFLADEQGGVHDFGTIVDLPLANLQPTPMP